MTALIVALSVLCAAAMILVLREFRSRISGNPRAGFRDNLTGLPTRALIEERLEKALARAQRNGYTLAVLVVSVDRFQLVNESLGQDHGALLLRAVAERLHGCLRDEDTLGRFGRDEFIILLEQVADATAPARVAERILSALAEPFRLAGEHVVPAGSIGIAVNARGTQPAADVIRDAEVAMRRAEQQDGSCYEMFDPSMRDLARKRLTLETGLRRALDNGELSVRYQPLIAMDSGDVTAAEALVRWQHPDRGELLPADFLNLAEQTGLIEPIGNWVLYEACRVGSQLMGADGRPPYTRMSVNLSERQLRAGPALVREVAETLRITGLPPELLTLEVTETVLVEERDPALSTLEALKELGVGIAIDDFGTGYSSLAYLRYLPVTMLKIDKSFVADLQDGVDTKIVKWMVSLGSALGLSVCAEGVETREQRDSLLELGCDTAQGYFYSRPVPEAELTETISRLRRQRPGGVRSQRVPAARELL
ncbi:MAG: putative bifunctional diguanylate cyclase/phosphodiesterase [Actinomycetota bacterium]